MWAAWRRRVTTGWVGARMRRMGAAVAAMIGAPLRIAQDDARRAAPRVRWRPRRRVGDTMALLDRLAVARRMKVFAITVAHNEDFFLDRWVWPTHGAQLGHENLFVIDHGSNDLSVGRLRVACPVNALRVPRTSFSDARRARAVAALHETL